MWLSPILGGLIPRKLVWLYIPSQKSCYALRVIGVDVLLICIISPSTQQS